MSEMKEQGKIYSYHNFIYPFIWEDSARKVNKLTTGRTNVGRVRRQPPPGTKSAPYPLSLPGGAALARAYRQSEPDALAG